MSSVEKILISHEEYRSAKYKSTSSSGGEHTARIIYNDDGSINDSTYSDSYKREHGCVAQGIKKPFVTFSAMDRSSVIMVS